MKKILTFGTFDLFHQGHRRYLEQAMALGGELYVCVARDINVKKYKHGVSSWDENKRRSVVQDEFPHADVMLGYEDDVYRCLSEIKPDIIALGYDQNIFVDKLNDELKVRGLENCKIMRMESFKPEKFKSSIVRKNIRKD